MSLGVSGWGSYLSSSVDAGANYIVRAEICKIDGPEIERKVLDLTHLLSPSNAREKAPGIMDAGHLTLDYNFTKAEFATMASFESAGTIVLWKITLSTLSTFVCYGFVQKVGLAVPFDDKITAPMTIEFTGAPTFTA